MMGVNDVVLLFPLTTRLRCQLEKAKTQGLPAEMVLDYAWDLVVEGDRSLVCDYADSFLANNEEYDESRYWSALTELFEDIYYLLEHDIEDALGTARDWNEIQNCVTHQVTLCRNHWQVIMTNGVGHEPRERSVGNS